MSGRCDVPVGRTLWNRRIMVHDGTELAADVVLPQGEEPFPTVVLRTPYVRGRPLNNPKNWVRLIEYGYALVTVDVRGRNDSEGVWIPAVKDPKDAHDVIEWAAGQSWSTGKIGMVGGSYEGLTQWWTLLGRPPHLRCVAPLCVGGVRHARPFSTGIPLQYWLWWMTLVLGRTMQFPGAPAWEAFMSHLPLAKLDERFGLCRSAWGKYVKGEIEFFSEAATLSQEDYAQIDIPVLIGVGWWDDQETMLAWQALQTARSAKECRLLIGAWDHAGNLAPRAVLGGLDVSASVMDTIEYIEQFLASHLKGERRVMADSPRCRIFLTGENRWEFLGTWPDPTAVSTCFYLDSGGDARSLRGNGRLTLTTEWSTAADTFVYDPNRPAREISNLAMFAWSDPPLDCRYLQRRCDALVYTSAPLARPLKVSGRYELRAFVSSDRPDTDLCVNLSDVHPDGRAVSLASTTEPYAALRLRYRNGTAAELMTPGEVYEVTVDGSWLHHVFKQGHRLRLTLSSGSFPLLARNAGTGGRWAGDEVLYPQTNTVHHSVQYPSRVVLPVVPPSGN